MTDRLTFSERADRLADARYEHFRAIREGKEARSAAWRSRYDASPKGEKPRCGAHARSTGKPCQAPALKNGRCKLHGGKATGPRTPEGKRRSIEAVQRGWARWRAERAALKAAQAGDSEIRG